MSLSALMPEFNLSAQLQDQGRRSCGFQFEYQGWELRKLWLASPEFETRVCVKGPRKKRLPGSIAHMRLGQA